MHSSVVGQIRFDPAELAGVDTLGKDKNPDKLHGDDRDYRDHETGGDAIEHRLQAGGDGTATIQIASGAHDSWDDGHDSLIQVRHEVKTLLRTKGPLMSRWGQHTDPARVFVQRLHACGPEGVVGADPVAPTPPPIISTQPGFGPKRIVTDWGNAAEDGAAASSASGAFAGGGGARVAPVRTGGAGVAPVFTVPTSMAVMGGARLEDNAAVDFISSLLITHYQEMYAGTHN